MKSEFYAQLEQLAREILENPSPDIESLQQTSRQLYEKLTIVRYTEEIMEQFAVLSSQSVQETPEDWSDQVSDQDDAVEVFEEIEEKIECESDACPVEETPEDWSDQVSDQDDAVEVFEEIEEKIECESDACPVEEKNDTDHKNEKKKPDDAQVSMFDFDLFDDKEIGYDPEDDIFEAKKDAEPDHKLEDKSEDKYDDNQEENSYIPTSFSGFQVIEEQDDHDDHDDFIEEEEVIIKGIDSDKLEEGDRNKEQKTTINDVLAEEAHSPSLNERFAVHNKLNIGLNDRLAFITHLFDGDAQAFSESVNYLSSVRDFGVAHEYIIEILKPAYKNWIDKQVYEKRFMDIVTAAFADGREKVH